jgi:hypothetical protein
VTNPSPASGKRHSATTPFGELVFFFFLRECAFPSKHGANVVVCCVAESEAYPRQRWFSDGRQGYGMANFAVASRKAEDTDPCIALPEASCSFLFSVSSIERSSIVGWVGILYTAINIRSGVTCRWTCYYSTVSSRWLRPHWSPSLSSTLLFFTVAF